MESRAHRWTAQIWRALVIALWATREIVRTAWGIARKPVILVLQLFAALIVLFEEWGWTPLSQAVAKLARYAPIARLEAWIASLGPYPSLLVFVLPSTLLLPLKFVAVWLLATGQVAAATGLFLGAKVVATALVARLFTLTQPSLMRIAWVARAYHWFVSWKDALFAIIRESRIWRYGRMVKTAVRQWFRKAWERWRPSVMAVAARVKTMFSSHGSA